MLQGDLVTAHPVELWVGGERVVQSNGANPKITVMGDDEMVLMGSDGGFSEPTPAYRCRIVKGDGILNKLDLKEPWELKFPEVGTRVRVFPRGGITESKMVGLAWNVVLETQRSPH